MFKRLLLTIILLPALALATQTPLTAAQAFKLSAKAIDKQTVTLNFNIAPGYHLYAPTVQIDSINNVKIDNIIAPRAILISGRTSGTYTAYAGKIKFGLALLNMQKQHLKLQVCYAGCSDSGFCYPLQKMQLNIPMTKFPSAIITPTPLAAQSKLSTTDKSLYHKAIPWMMLTFFGLGILVAFSPCVLPMLPILYATITAGNKRLPVFRTIILALSYVLGMAISYAAAGVAAGYIGHSLQAQLQSPAVIVPMIIIITLMAAASLDLIHFRAPKVLHNILASKRKSGGGSVIGSFFMGAFAILIISPCVTPPLIGVLTFIANSGSPIVGAAALFALALGMGLPLVLIATLGSKYIPKTGPWMRRVKHLLGIILLGLAVWLLTRIISDKTYLLLWAAWAIGSGVILGGFKMPARYLYARLRFAFCWILILLGIIWLAGFIQNKQSLFYPIQQRVQIHYNSITSSKQLATILQAKENSGKLFMLYFSAKWCASCLWMEADLFTKPQVAKALRHAHILKIDVSKQTAEQLKIMNKYKVIAPPTFIFIKNNKEVPDSRRVGQLSAADFTNNPQLNIQTTKGNNNEQGRS